MTEATIQKHLDTAIYKEAEEQHPDGVHRWYVKIERKLGDVTMDVAADDEKTARKEAEKAYRNYLKVTGATE